MRSNLLHFFRTAGSYPQTAPKSASLATRTSGQVPVAVLFNAVDATIDVGGALVLPVSGSDYAAWNCRWNFGDPGSGTWSTTGRSKNEAIGLCATHIYETPGTYTIQLTVIAPDGTTAIYTDQITVSAYSGTLYYVSATGSDSNDGLSTSTPWQTVAKVAANTAANRRFLFKRGDTFSQSVGVGISSTKTNGGIGAYGTGARPIINVGNTDGGWTITADDWVVMDIEFVGAGIGVDNAYAITTSISVTVDNLTILRCKITQFRVGVSWDTAMTTPHANDTIAECEMSDCQVDGIFCGGRYLSIIGCNIHDMTGSHLVRVWQADRSAIQANILYNPGTNRHCIKLHSPNHTSGRPETSFVSIAGNDFKGKEETIVLGPQNTILDERVSQVIVEQCIFHPVSTIQVDVLIEGNYITVRDCIFIATGDFHDYQAVSVGITGAVPVVDGAQIYSNTVYRADSGTTLYFTRTSGSVQNVTVKNNFGSAPSVTTTAAVLVLGSCPGLVQSNNQFSNSPGFLNAGAGDFHLTGGSPAIDAGVALTQVRYDYDMVSRPLTGTSDQGCYQT